MSTWSFLWHRARRVGKTHTMAEACKKLGATLVCAHSHLAEEIRHTYSIDAVSVDHPHRLRGRTDPVLFEPEAVAAMAERYEERVSEANTRAERAEQRAAEAEKALERADQTINEIQMALRLRQADKP